jgi:hypothetical protein
MCVSWGGGRVFPYAGIQFMTFDAAKYEILQVTGKQQLSNVESLFAGSFAGPSRLSSPLNQAPGAQPIVPYIAHSS